jgi:FkbM family methyltransferase
VAVEPQPACVAALRRAFGDRVTIVPSALAAAPGEAPMFVSDASTLSTLSREWVESLGEGRFAEFSWDASETVETTTLDALIAAHGRPAFCKIDVEGYEEQVLAGLSTPLPRLSIEFVPERAAATVRCVDRLLSLGDYRFNLALGERPAFTLPGWVGRDALLAELERLRGTLVFGDVYASEAAAGDVT